MAARTAAAARRIMAEGSVRVAEEK